MMMRCTKDLGLAGQKSKQALFFPDPYLQSMNMEGVITEDGGAVYLKCNKDGRPEEYLIPLESIEVLRLFPEAETKSKPKAV